MNIKAQTVLALVGLKYNKYVTRNVQPVPILLSQPSDNDTTNISDVNECLRNPCQHNCHNVRGSYTCSCHSCYTKVGTRCELRQCGIAGACYSYGTVHPRNQCQVIYILFTIGKFARLNTEQLVLN